MKIYYDNVDAQVTGTDAEVDWVEAYLTAEDRVFEPADPRTKKPPSFKTTHRSIYCRRDGTFPTGLLKHVYLSAKQAGLVVHVHCRVKAPIEPNPDVRAPWLRDYQAQTIEKMRKCSRGIIEIATGGGKTEIILAATSIYGCEWLICTKSQDIIEGVANRVFERLGERAGTWDTKKGWRRGTTNITVATTDQIRSSVNRAARGKPVEGWADFVQSIEGICADEVHQAGAEGFYTVLRTFENAYYRYGFSATPLKRDEFGKLRVVGCTGPVIMKIGIQELTEAGYLAAPEVCMFQFTHKYPSAPGSAWRGIYAKNVVYNKARNSLVSRMALDAPKPAIVFVDEHKQGQAILNALKGQGLSVGSVSGKSSKAQRTKAVSGLGSGDLDVLVAISIFKTGVDIPSLQSVILANAKKATIATIQTLGRGTRLAAGKTSFCVFDVFDQEDNVLERHAFERSEIYQSLGYEVKVLDSDEQQML